MNIKPEAWAVSCKGWGDELRFTEEGAKECADNLETYTGKIASVQALYGKEAADRAEILEEALKTVLASLVATTSILIRAEHGKCTPSKAVGSDAMFTQMLKDYDIATIVGRKALIR